MLLLRYWKQHGQPRVLHTVPGLPVNDVFIEARGREAIRIGSTVVRLERYAIDGVVWGRETVWLDERGVARRGDHARRRPQLRGGARGSRAGAGRLRRSARRAIASPISKRSPRGSRR